MNKIKGKVMQDEYYNFNYINSMQADIKGVFSLRGIGKTYGKLNQLVKKCIEGRYQMLYLVELGEHLKELTAKGGKLFISQLYEQFPPENLKMEGKNVYWNYDPTSQEGDWGLLIEVFDLASFGKAKRTKHGDIRKIVFDECIEVSNRRNTFTLSKAFASVVESFVRNKECEVWLFGNMENPTSEFVTLCKLDNEDNKGYYYTFTHNDVSFAVHYVDCPREYPVFWEKKKNSTSGKISRLFDSALTNNELIVFPLKYKPLQVMTKPPKFSMSIKGEFYDVYRGAGIGTKHIYIEKVSFPHHYNYISYTKADGGVYNPKLFDSLNEWIMLGWVKCVNQYTFACLRNLGLVMLD